MYTGDALDTLELFTKNKKLHTGLGIISSKKKNKLMLFEILLLLFGSFLSVCSSFASVCEHFAFCIKYH